MRVAFTGLREGLDAVNAAAERLADAQWQVASGRRMRGASDDPAGMRRVLAARTDLGQLDSYVRTTDSATGRLAALDAFAGDVGDQLTRALTVAQGALGSQANQAGRDAAAAALLGVRDAVLSDINGTYDGVYLFSGTTSNMPAYANVGGNWTYQGNASTAKMQIDENRQVNVTADGQSILKGADATDILTALETLAADVSAGNQAGITSGIQALRNGADRAVRAQALVGADQQQVADQYQRLSGRRQDVQSRIVRDEDVNFAEAVTRMTEAQNAYQAALGALAATRQPSLFDYLK